MAFSLSQWTKIFGLSHAGGWRRVCCQRKRQIHALPFQGRTQHSGQAWHSYDPLASWFSSLCQQIPKHLLLIMFFSPLWWLGELNSFPKGSDEHWCQRQGHTGPSMLGWGGHPAPFQQEQAPPWAQQSHLTLLITAVMWRRERLSGDRGMASPQPGMFEMFPSHQRALLSDTNS